MANMIVCPKCGNINQPTAVKCNSCGYELVPETLKFLQDVPGLNASTIQKLYISGFKNVEDLRMASVREISKVEGISRIMAERIKQHILKLELTGEQKKVSLYICSHCGALLSEKSTSCPQCGAAVIQDTEAEVPLETKPSKEEEKLIKELEKPKITLFLCSNCGAFVSSDARACPNCGALMEGGSAEEEAEVKEEKPEVQPVGIAAAHETDGAIIGVCSSCGAFLSRSVKACPVCGSPAENNISVAINSLGETETGGPETPIRPDFAFSGFDPKLESEGKIFLCEVCGAFVAEGATVCPVCSSPTANMRKEVIRIGAPEEMGSEEVINLLEKEIIEAMENAEHGETVRAEKKVEEPQPVEEPEIVELHGFDVIEAELNEVIPEERPEAGSEQGDVGENVVHLDDVHSAITSELGDILVESVVKERFSFEDHETPEKVEHSHDPVGEVESELWEYFFDETEEKTEGEETECPICGYKNLPDAEKCEICGSTIMPEEVEKKEKEAPATPVLPKKVKKEVVVEEKKAQPETDFREVKKVKKEVMTVPVGTVEMKPFTEGKKGILASAVEKNYYLLLGIALAGVGVISLLVFGLTVLAAGVIAAGFLSIGVIFSLMILKAQKKEERVQKNMRIAVPARPSEIALFNMGSTYLATGRFGEAVKTFEEVVKINPGNEVAWNNLGSALSKLEKHGEALKCYEKALEIKPDFEIAWNNKGNALARMGRFEEALECYDKAIALKKDYHDAWVNKGYVLVKIGRYNEAIACANEANKLMERTYA
ncbi:MAG: tetratricopeptide repeat protein [Thermoplasmata archaeon]|nr:tetratricopeptide repeat protein [Thermoplasmata archaeon]